MQPCDPSSSTVTLATSHREDTVQVVFAGPQMTSPTFARVYIGLVDISRRHASVICTVASSAGNLVVPQTRRRISDSTASMEQSASRAEAAAIDHLFSSST